MDITDRKRLFHSYQTNPMDDYERALNALLSLCYASPLMTKYLLMVIARARRRKRRPLQSWNLQVEKPAPEDAPGDLIIDATSHLKSSKLETKLQVEMKFSWQMQSIPSAKNT